MKKKWIILKNSVDKEAGKSRIRITKRVVKLIKKKEETN